MLLSTKNVATYAAIRPNKTKSIVAINPWNELLATSLNVLFANRHPTDAPRINKQKLIEEAAGQGYNVMVLARVINVMAMQGELLERNQGRLIKRIR